MAQAPWLTSKRGCALVAVDPARLQAAALDRAVDRGDDHVGRVVDGDRERLAVAAAAKIVQRGGDEPVTSLPVPRAEAGEAHAVRLGPRHRVQREEDAGV